MENVSLDQVYAALIKIQKTMITRDEMREFIESVTLTDEESEELDASIENYKKGKVVDFEELKSELGI